MKAALDGIRVLDLTTVIFGPYTSQILADYGAEVIKVESWAGDSTRYTGPSQEKGMSAMFLSVNRNKKSIVVDLKTVEGIGILKKLLKSTDVFIHNIRPQKMKKLGLDYESLKDKYPSLVYTALYGFGSAGRYSGRPAYDDIIQGLSAIPDLIHKQSELPRYFPAIVADKSCALMAAHAILAALFQRAKSFKGQFVEVPMFESMVSFNLLEHYYDQHLKDISSKKQGYARVLSGNRRPYATKNGYICVMPYTDKHWLSLFSATNRFDLINDEKFKDIASRTQNIDALYNILASLMQSKTTEEWLDFLDEHDIPNARVNTLESIEDDPHLQDIGFFQKLSNNGHQYSFMSNPIYLSDSDVPLRMPPKLGEHTTDILSLLKFSEEEIKSLYEREIVR